MTSSGMGLTGGILTTYAYEKKYLKIKESPIIFVPFDILAFTSIFLVSSAVWYATWPAALPITAIKYNNRM